MTNFQKGVILVGAVLMFVSIVMVGYGLFRLIGEAIPSIVKTLS